MDQTVSRRFEPSSRTTLMGEQPNPWNVLPLQDVMSRHRGAKPSRRCELLGKISLLSLELESEQFSLRLITSPPKPYVIVTNHTATQQIYYTTSVVVLI